MDKMITALCKRGKLEITLEGDNCYYCSCCGNTFDNNDIESCLYALCMALGVDMGEL